MSRHLPPLNALRAFEAAGRHLSLSRAAEELHVTPAAVSHQVKSLEAALGVKLFRRAHRALMLTDAGQVFLAPLSEGFDRLAQGVEQVRRADQSRPLTVSVAPTFGAKWLVPRLDRFRERHSELDVRVDASMRLVDLDREDIDVAIRYGPGSYPGYRVECLLAEEVIPVCSPSLLEGPRPLREPADLGRQVLLHHDYGPGDDGYPDWPMWLRAAGVSNVDASRGPRFNPATMVVEAAIEGQGVALMGHVLVAEDLAKGRLVQPFELAVPVNFAYYLVCSEHNADAARIRAFRTWLHDEARPG